MRIGPWAHGECREGGFPGWLVDKAFEWANGDAKKARQILRSRDARFLGETRKLFERVHSEVAPHFWKGLPIRYALRRLPKGTKHLVLKVLPRGAGWVNKIYIDRALLPNSAVVSSEGLANQDRHHFDREGQRILGGRYYDAFKSM